MKVKISETFKTKNMTPSFIQLLAQAVIALSIGLALAKLIRYVRDRYVEIDPDDQNNNWFNDALINKILSTDEEAIF